MIDHLTAESFNRPVGSSEIIVVFSVLCLVVLLAPMCIGILGIRRAGKGGAWWTMFAGMVLLSLGWLSIAGFSLLLVFSARASSPAAAWMLSLPSIGSIGLASGTCVFAFGYCFHGLRIGNLRKRNEELEQLSHHLSEEIQRLRKGGNA